MIDILDATSQTYTLILTISMYWKYIRQRSNCPDISDECKHIIQLFSKSLREDAGNDMDDMKKIE